MGPFRSYWADVRRDAGSKLSVATALVAAGAVVEGFGILAILPFAALITGNTDTQIAAMILAVMDMAGLSSEGGRGIALGGLFLGVLALRNAIIWQRDVALNLLSLGYVDRLRSRLFRAITEAEWPALNALRRSDIQHAIVNDIGRLTSGTNQLLKSGAAVAMIIVQAGLIAWLAPKLLLLVLGLLAMAALLAAPLISKADGLGRKITRSGRRIHRVLGDFMASQKLARLNNAEHAFLARFDHAVEDVRTHQMAFFRSQVAARLWFQFAAGVVVIGALLAGYFLLETPLSVLAVTLVVLARLAGPVQLVVQTAQSMANILPAYSALQSVMRQLPPRTPPGTTRAGSHADLAGPADVQMQNISFSYSPGDKPVLSSANLKIRAGEILALSGRSGAGKTTLLDILCGLYEPDQGTLLVNGKTLSCVSDMHWWRSRIAYLPQDPFLFDTTLRDNLTWSAPEASENAIRSALDIAEAAAFVDRLPEGLDSRAGERGQSLSGGERQRLCLARALLRRPRLLVLDEATNALDAALEDRILARIASMQDQFSVLLVTHRPNTLRHADRIVRLEEGQIFEV